MIKDAMMKKASKDLAQYADKGFKVLQDKINRVNEQNDMMIDTMNMMIKIECMKWEMQKKLNPDASSDFKDVEKKYDMDMKWEG